MTKKCIGCGIRLQWQNANSLGYIKKDKINEAKYCQRCFRMMNYNDINIVDLPFNYSKVIKEVNDKKYFVFFLVDLFNLNKEIINTYKEIRNSKCLIISKLDLIPKSFNLKKIKDWLNKNYNIKEQVIFLSSLKNRNLQKIFTILNQNETKKCFVMGYTNSGKSTFINALNKDAKNKINTSIIPNTTLDFINVYYDEYTFIDTPGFNLESTIYNANDIDLIKKINSKKFIKPSTYQMKENASIIIENKLRITNLNDLNSFTFYMSDDIDLKKVFENNDGLKEYELRTYHVNNNTDVIIKGLGFINIKKKCDINIYTLNHEVVEFRNSFLGKEYYE